ncbi:DUF2529 family protein [Thalassobacillus pellis]|uniref:DUF2529 family protein n=1 Tax=Thalassobacillus pellis TaxID=748008 RepID=UPI001961933C|nr:DUF2529 family protein [Thalassobacillus pellis]MBM7551790.1 putative phosphosugar-binding protein [Thalassobacillus pellis]
MLKMLTTQLTGKFQQIQEKEEFAIEDAARALAQAIVGDGKIYVKGFGEMKALEAEMLKGKETLPKCFRYKEDVTLSDIDRIIIASRFTDDEDAIVLTEKAQEQGAQVISLSAADDSDDPSKQQADFHIDTKVTDSLLPFDMERICFPAVLTMLYAYYGIFVTVKEILSEYE